MEVHVCAPADYETGQGSVFCSGVDNHRMRTQKASVTASLPEPPPKGTGVDEKLLKRTLKNSDKDAEV